MKLTDRTMKGRATKSALQGKRRSRAKHDGPTTRLPRFETLEGRLLLATVTINPSKDNILLQANPSDLSCGVGNSLYIGRTGGSSGGLHNRSAIAFDLTTAGIPAGSTITNAELQLRVTKSASISGSIVPEPVTIHKLNIDWGEGASGDPCDLRNQVSPAAPGDTTWTHRVFPNVLWGTPGGTGDFEATASATTMVIGTGSDPMWSSAGMAADLQGWLDNPSTNFGWMMVGNEAKPLSSARRFASRHVGGAPQLTITFEQTANLSVAIAADSVSEGAGPAATTATVSRTGDTSNALVVTLASNDAGEATVPASVAIPAGQASSPAFNIDAVDDSIVDGTQTVTITASGSGGIVSGTDTLDVTDDDVAALTLVIAAASIAESAGAGATTATVSRNTDTTNALLVNLGSRDLTEATVQASVTIAAGQATSAAFNIDAVDDSIVDGTQTVMIVASATGLADGTDTVDVTDDDVAGGKLVGQTINGGSANRSGVATAALDFDQNVTINSAASLKLWNHTIGSAIDTTGATYSGSGTNQVTWNFSALTLPDGNYTAKLPNTEGTLAATHSFVFLVAAGDSNGDGSVGFGDFGDLAGAFNTSGGAPYGPGDMNGDGDVNFGDFGILATNFNNSLAALGLDFGDAPAPFLTLLPDGARHVLGSGLTLGATVDAEVNGQPDAAANGDGGDEDGVTFGALQAGTNSTITVNAVVPGTAVLNAWIDFNNDGDWADTGEQIFADQAVVNGTNTLTAAIPAGATPGPAFARFRISSCGGHTFTGLARDGEVEDYAVTLVAAKASSSGRDSTDSSNLAAAFIAESNSPLTSSVDTQSGNGQLESTAASIVDLAIDELTAPDVRPSASDGLVNEKLLDQVYDEQSDLLSPEDDLLDPS